MRIYHSGSTELNSIICNCCGKNMPAKDGMVREGYFSLSQQFGYFSSKDGEIHNFDLCEKCYDKIISEFQIPVEITETGEMI